MASGPEVDLGYSTNVEANISCTEEGFIVTATLTFNDGEILKNSLWRPEIKLLAVTRQPNVTVTVKWEIRLGNDLKGKFMGDFPDLKKYPITVSKTIN